MPEILEVTIRDGGYEVGYQFTEFDVALLSGLLGLAGFRYIEVGHGAGIGASAIPRLKGGEVAAVRDDDFVRIAKAAAPHSKVGCPFFPFEGCDWNAAVRVVADNGGDFLRIIVHPTEVTAAYTRSAVSLARELGLLVAVNLLKSPNFTPAAIGESAHAAEDIGAHWLYVVDSSGSFLPDDVRRYIAAARESAPRTRIGFHAHNNLCAAVPNSIAAVQEGATLVDGSFQGLGRATGNAPTEHLVTLLQDRFGAERQIHRPLAYAIGRSVVQRWIQPGFDPTDVLIGAAAIHSNRMPAICARAAKAGMPVDDILDRLSRAAQAKGWLFSLKNDELDALFEEIGRDYAPRPAIDLGPVARRAVEELAPPSDSASLFARLKVAAKRDHRQTILCLAPDTHAVYRGSAVARVGEHACVGWLSTSSGDKVPKDWPDWLRSVCVDQRLRGAVDLPDPRVTWVRFDRLAATATAWAVARRRVFALTEDAEFGATFAALQDEPVERLGRGERDLRDACLVVQGPRAAAEIVSLLDDPKVVSTRAQLIALGEVGDALFRAARRADMELVVPPLNELVVSRLEALTARKNTLCTDSLGLVCAGGEIVGRWCGAPAADPAALRDDVRSLAEPLHAQLGRALAITYGK